MSDIEITETRLAITKLVLSMKEQMISENATLNHLTDGEQFDLAKKKITEIVFSTFVTDGSLIGKTDRNGKEMRNGDTVKGVGEHDGQSAIFPTESYDGSKVIWQPFSYLSDYEGHNYKVIETPKEAT